MKEVEFMQSPAQGNIYSTTRLGNVSLIGSGNYGKILAHVNPTVLSEAPLSSIPLGSDIIGLDACHDFSHSIIGVTFIQTTQVGIEEVKTAYLNFYTTWTPVISDCQERWPYSRSRSKNPQPIESMPTSLDFNLRQLEIIGQKCVQFKLNFIPYHLSHCRVKKSTGIYETVFLLSGSDYRIYIYEPSYEAKSFAQIPIQVYFPELDGTFPSVVTRIRMEILLDLKKRITICGCEDGQLRCFIVSDSESGLVNITSPSDLSHDYTDTVFQDGTPSSQPCCDSPAGDETARDSCGDSLASSMNEDLEFGHSVQKVTNNFDGMITAIEIYSDGSTVNAVVSSSNSPVYIFTDVLNQIFQKGVCLKFSSRWDSVQAVCVADIDFDGQCEIVIGTFGCTLLVYKMAEQLHQWVIIAHRKLPSAIYAVDFFDDHLHVVTTCGLHIIQFSNEASFDKYGLQLESEASEELSVEEGMMTASVDNEEE